MIVPSWLANPVTRYLVIALVAVAAGTGLYIKGRADGSALTEAAVAEERRAWEAKVADTQREHDVYVAVLTSDFKKKEEQYQKEINKWENRPTGNQSNPQKPDPVIVYVPQKVDAVIPRGFIDLHDTAALGLPTSDAVRPDAEQPSGIKLSDVGAIVAGNYYQCNTYIDRLNALQDIVADYMKRQKELIK